MKMDQLNTRFEVLDVHFSPFSKKRVLSGISVFSIECMMDY